MTHDFFMHRCLALASQARDKTGTNPMVGAVLVRDGKVVAEGIHSEFGKPHAELTLLQKFEQEIRSEDILYVNLEPCCHTDKKTPPCAQLLVERGIKHIVFGMIDPNTKVSGKGIALLYSKGVECLGPVLLADSLRLNRGFVSLMTKGRPWITLKSARSGDSTISNPDGSPKHITSKEQDQWSHAFLRARHDAILVGVGTVIADDPKLTVRVLTPAPSPDYRDNLERGVPLQAGRGEDPWRIVLDPNGKIPLTAKIVNGVLAKRTIVVTTKPNEELSARGVRVVQVSCIDSTFDWTALWKALTTTEGDFHGISSILVEGGQQTWEFFRNAGMVDEEVVLIGK